MQLHYSLVFEDTILITFKIRRLTADLIIKKHE